MKQKLTKVGECIKYVESLGYELIGRCAGGYYFRDTTGTRPLHNQEMTWTLGEMRHAVKYGC